MLSSLLVGSRLAFAAYFLAVFGSHVTSLWPYLGQRFPLVWGAYMLILYGCAERIYAAFRRRGIDLSFAFPLLFAVYLLNLTSILVRSQEDFPLVNRAEHLVTFVLLAYIVWIFFLKYLPQKVWDDHPYYTAILVLAIAALAGVGNEIVELTIDRIFGTHAVGNGFDTSLDLLMNTLGSGLFLAVTLILREGKITFSNSR